MPLTCCPTLPAVRPECWENACVVVKIAEFICHNYHFCNAPPSEHTQRHKSNTPKTFVTDRWQPSRPNTMMALCALANHGYVKFECFGHIPRFLRDVHIT